MPNFYIKNFHHKNLIFSTKKNFTQIISLHCTEQLFFFFTRTTFWGKLYLHSNFHHPTPLYSYVIFSLHVRIFIYFVKLEYATFHIILFYVSVILLFPKLFRVSRRRRPLLSLSLSSPLPQLSKWTSSSSPHYHHHHHFLSAREHIFLCIYFFLPTLLVKCIGSLYLLHHWQVTISLISIYDDDDDAHTFIFFCPQNKLWLCCRVWQKLPSSYITSFMYKISFTCLTYFTYIESLLYTFSWVKMWQ